MSDDVCSCVLYLMSDAIHGFCKINTYNLFLLETVQFFFVSICLMKDSVRLTEFLKGKDSPSACCPSWHETLQ